MNKRLLRMAGIAAAFILGASVVASAQASQGQGDEPAYASSLTIGATPTITPNQAQIAALAANPGASALSVHLEDENGQLVYTVEMISGAEVKVDAGNGKILYTDVTEPHGGNQEENQAESQGENAGDHGIADAADEESDKAK